MKFLKILLKIKRRELREEEKKLSLLLKELQELETRRENLLRTLKKTSALNWKDINLLSFKNSYQHHLLKELSEVKREIGRIEKAVEKQKEKVALLNSEIKLLEKRKELIRRNEEKREDILLERFINEVLYRPEPD